MSLILIWLLLLLFYRIYCICFCFGIFMCACAFFFFILRLDISILLGLLFLLNHSFQNTVFWISRIKIKGCSLFLFVYFDLVFFILLFVSFIFSFIKLFYAEVCKKYKHHRSIRKDVLGLTLHVSFFVYLNK